MKKHVLLLAMFAALIPAALSAQVLFEVSAPGDSPRSVAAAAVDGGMGPDIEVTESFNIRLDTSLLASGPAKIALPSFDGGPMQWVQRTGFEERDGGSMWRGGSEGGSPTHAHAVFTTHDGFTVGSFWAGGRSWEIRADAAGVGRVVADTMKEPHGEWCGASSEPWPDAFELPVYMGDRIPPGDALGVAVNEARTSWKVDVLFIVTEDAEYYMNTVSSVEAEARALVDYANLVYDNSTAFATLNYVGWEPSPYDVDYSYSALFDVGSNVNRLHALRKEYNADLVHVLNHNVITGYFFGICGEARVLMDGWDAQTMARHPYGYTDMLCDDLTRGYAKYTFAHEVGHNFGAWHNREVAAPPCVFDARLGGKPRDCAGYGFLSHPKRKERRNVKPLDLEDEFYARYPNADHFGVASIMSYTPSRSYNPHWKRLPFFSTGGAVTIVDKKEKRLNVGEAAAHTYGLCGDAAPTKCKRLPNGKRPRWVLGDEHADVAWMTYETVPVIASLSDWQYEVSRVPRDFTFDAALRSDGGVKFDLGWVDDSADEMGFRVVVKVWDTSTPDWTELPDLVDEMVDPMGGDPAATGDRMSHAFEIAKDPNRANRVYEARVSSHNMGGDTSTDWQSHGPVLKPTRPKKVVLGSSNNPADRWRFWVVVDHDGWTDSFIVRTLEWRGRRTGWVKTGDETHDRNGVSKSQFKAHKVLKKGVSYKVVVIGQNRYGVGDKWYTKVFKW